MRNRSSNYPYLFIGILFIILLWYFGCFMNPSKIPMPPDVLNDLFAEKVIHYENTMMTFNVAVQGLLYAFIISLILVLSVAFFPKLEFVFTPTIVMLKSTPLIAFVPLIIMFFKFSKTSLIVSSIIICFYPLVIAGFEGINKVPKKLKILSEVYAANKVSYISNISIIYILESMLAGLKIAAPLSLVGALVGQFLVGVKYAGLGGYIFAHSNPHDINPKYISIILSSLIGLIMYICVYIIHKIFIKYAHLQSK